MRIYYSGVTSVDLLGTVHVGYCRTCQWVGAETEASRARDELAEHRRSHERAA